MPYGEYEIQKDKCYYSGIEIIQNCKGIKGCIYKQLQRAKAELKKYEDMAKKGLEEFKDVGGCWGCGLQLQLNQDMEDIKKLKTENERLKEELRTEKIYSSQIEELEESLQHAKAENKDLKTYIKRMDKPEIKTIDSEIALLNAELQQENKRLIARLRPLEDSYFKGLSSIQIAELAKKSIRITAENRKLEDALQEIRKMLKGHNVADEVRIKSILAKINEVIGAE